MTPNFQIRLNKIEDRLNMKRKVYINQPADCSIDGLEHWKDFTGEIKKPKKFNPADVVIIDNIPMSSQDSSENL